MTTIGNREFFKGINKIEFEGKESKNPLAFKYYNPDQIVAGKTMRDHFKFAVAYWHSFCGQGADPFGVGTQNFPWDKAKDPFEASKDKADAAFEFISKMGFDYFCFHDFDLIEESDDFSESEDRLNFITDYVENKMKKLAQEKNLITQMGIQVHSFYDYKLATLLIKSGIIGKVNRVRAWCPKNWGYDGPEPTGSDDIPSYLDWNLWLGTAKERPYKDKIYHPGMWRKLVDFGCGTLGDMGVHIFDTPYNALELDVPMTIKNKCRKPNNFGFPEKNYVEYVFPGTKYTTETLTWIWEDGKGSPRNHKDLKLPNNDKLPLQGAMFIGEKGRLLLPHFMEIPKLIVDNKYQDFDVEPFVKSGELSEIPVRDYGKESYLHYHQFIDTCLGKDTCTAPFSYSSNLTETILLGVIAGRFPGKTLNWDSSKARFKEEEANKYLDSPYRNF